LCLSPVTLSRFCFRVFFEAVARNRYIELDTNWPTATGGRGASRSDVDAPDHRREGTCVCVDGHSLGPAATLVGRSSRASFAAALPTRAQIPALLGEVLVQATDSGIVLEQGKYTFSPATSSRLARYTFEFPIKSDYGNIRNFINKSLAAVPALGLDKLHVERKNVGDTLVSADVGFVIYLRGA